MKTKILLPVALIAAFTFSACQKADQPQPKVIVTQEQATDPEVVAVVNADVNKFAEQIIPIIDDTRKDVKNFFTFVAKDIVKNKQKADARAEKCANQCMKERKKMHAKAEKAAKKCYKQHQKEMAKKEKELAKHENISNRQVRSIVMKEMADNDVVNAYVPIKTGYYECPCDKQRLNLYKLAVNGILTLTCEEIMKTEHTPSYWVNVELTPAGKNLIRRELFPEELIKVGEAGLFISPDAGKDVYGRVIKDTDVPADVDDLIHLYYKDMVANPHNARKHCSRDLQLAYDRIDSVAKYNHQEVADPAFVPADANLDEIKVIRWNQYEDAYIVKFAKKQVIMMIRKKDGKLVIDDIAFCTPEKMNKQTVGKRGRAITNKEIYRLRKAEEKRLKAANKRNNKEPEIIEEPIYVNNEPGFITPDLTELTPAYQEAKAKEYAYTYELFAYEVAVVNVAEKAYAKRQCCCAPSKATALVTLQKKNVNAVGRVFCQAEEGSSKTIPFYFIYKCNDGWQICSKEDYEFVPEMKEETCCQEMPQCHMPVPACRPQVEGCKPMPSCEAQPCPPCPAPACAAPAAMSTDEAVKDIENSLEKIFNQYINDYANFIANSLK